MNYQEKDTILYLNDVELGYGRGNSYKPVLKNINLVEKDIIKEGRITGQSIAVVGRSGRGKSTLFKALTGLIKPTSGNIYITDLSTEDTSDAKIVEEGDIGFVDQKYTLFRHKTVEQILRYAMRKDKRTSGEKNAIINQSILDWGIFHQKNQYPNELSGGQRQRVAILEQILSLGHFTVFDEPTSGLDVPGIENVKKNFNLILNQHELNTIIFSTHLIEFAVEMAEVIYFIGHPTETSDYSTIIKRFDLRERGLAWQRYGAGHQEVTNEIKNLMLIH